MLNKLYVGNLDWSITNEELAQFFETAGAVESAMVIKFHDSGKSKGFGFVTMIDEEGAKNGLKLDQLEFKSRKIIVREAMPEGTHKKESLKVLFDFLNSDVDQMPLKFEFRGKSFVVEKIMKIATE